MFEIAVEDTFDAAHFLRGYQGSCERLHGHTYKVQIVLRTEGVDATGISADFREVKSALRDALAELDHQCLNDLAPFTEVNPTAENLACYLFDSIKPALSAPLHRVTVWETPTSSATYFK